MDHKQVIGKLLAEAMYGGDTHLACICNIALDGRVSAENWARMEEMPRKTMADMYGVDGDGISQMDGAQQGAAAECVRFFVEQQEAVRVPDLMTAVQTVLADRFLGGGGSGPIKPLGGGGPGTPV